MEETLPPDEKSLALMHSAISGVLAVLHAKLGRFVLNIDQAYNLVDSKFSEVFDAEGILRIFKVKQLQVLKLPPPQGQTVKLGNTTIGISPGLFAVEVAWTPEMIQVYVFQLPTGNLRTTADICA